MAKDAPKRKSREQIRADVEDLDNFVLEHGLVSEEVVRAAQTEDPWNQPGGTT